MKKLFPLLLIALVSFYSCRQKQVVVDKQAVAAVIDSIENEMLTVIKSHDIEKFMSYYAEDAVFMNQGDPVLTGIEEIKKASVVVFADTAMLWNSYVWKNERTDVSDAGDMAVVRGSYSMQLKTPQGVIDVSGKGIEVFRKENGAWKIIYNVYNNY